MAKLIFPTNIVQFCGLMQPYSEKGNRFRRNIDEFETHLSQCEECGYCRYDPLPSVEDLSTFYQAEYGAASESVYNLKAQYERPDLDSVAEHLIAQIRQYGYNGAEQLEAHDVGCSLGMLVYILRKHGVNATGTEINRGWVEAGNNFCDGALSAEPLDAYFKNSQRKLHLVTLLHTLEHMPNPLNELLEVRLRLHQEGILYICVPNALFLPAQVFGKEVDENFIFPAHLHLFTPKSMSCLLRAAGLKIMHLETRPSHFTENGKDSFMRAALGLDAAEVADEVSVTRGFAENFRTAELHVIATRDDRPEPAAPPIRAKIEAHAKYERPFWRRVDTAIARTRDRQFVLLITDRPQQALWEWAPRLAELQAAGRLVVRTVAEIPSYAAQPAVPLASPDLVQIIVDGKVAGPAGGLLASIALHEAVLRSEV